MPKILVRVKGMKTSMGTFSKALLPAFEFPKISGALFYVPCIPL
jgi:hypothetical protein